MKKVSLLACFICSVFIASGQNFVTNNYQGFIDQDNSTVVQVSKLAFQMASEVISGSDDEDVQEVRDIISQVESFQLVKVDDLDNAQSEYSNGVGKLSNDYDELLNVKDGSDRFSLHIDEDNGTIYELVGLGYDEGDFVAFSLVGEIPLDQIGEIIGKIQSEQMSDVEGFSTLKVSEVNVFPNPVSAQNVFNLEVEQELVGAKATVVDINGQIVHSFTINNQVEKVRTNGLKNGYYIVAIEKGPVTVKKKINVIQ